MREANCRNSANKVARGQLSHTLFKIELMKYVFTSLLSRNFSQFVGEGPDFPFLVAQGWHYHRTSSAKENVFPVSSHLQGSASAEYFYSMSVNETFLNVQKSGRSQIRVLYGKIKKNRVIDPRIQSSAKLCWVLVFFLSSFSLLLVPSLSVQQRGCLSAPFMRMPRELCCP